MRTTNFSIALCEGSVDRNVSDSWQEGQTSYFQFLSGKNKVFHVCCESDGVWWWYQLCQQAGKTEGGGERAVPTKSWNVRPERNSCCTPCPDRLTACDSRENNRINNHSHTLRETHRETAPLSTTCCGLWTQLELSAFLSSPSTTKRGNFQQPWFWAVSSAANGKPQEEWGGRERAGGVCGAEQTQLNDSDYVYMHKLLFSAHILKRYNIPNKLFTWLMKMKIPPIFQFTSSCASSDLRALTCLSHQNMEKWNGFSAPK